MIFFMAASVTWLRWRRPEFELEIGVLGAFQAEAQHVTAGRIDRDRLGGLLVGVEFAHDVVAADRAALGIEHGEFHHFPHILAPGEGELAHELSGLQFGAEILIGEHAVRRRSPAGCRVFGRRGRK
jgi:hypothetical protein